MKLAEWWSALLARLRRAPEALDVLSTTPQVLRLVWDAHPRFAIALVALNLAQGLEPLALIWTAKWVIDALAAAVVTGGQPTSPRFLQPIGAWIAGFLGYAGPGAGPAGDAAGAAVGAAVAALFGVIALRWLLTAISNVLQPSIQLVEQQLGDHLIREITQRIQRKANSLADLSYFESPEFYDALQRAQGEAQSRPINVLRGLVSLFRTTIQLTSMLVVLLTWQPKIAALAAVLAVPQLVVRMRLQRANFSIYSWSVPEVRHMRYSSGLLTSKEQAKEVRLFGLGDYFLQRYLRVFADYHARYRTLRLRECWLETTLSAAAAFGSSIAYAFIALAALARQITLGSLSLYLSAFYQVQNGVASIVNSLATLYGDNLFIRQVFEFLNTTPTMPLPDPAVAMPAPRPMRRGIEFRHVGFRYPGTERMVLADVSFTVEPGQSVAIVGENGAGKTTLIKLLTRLYDPTQGQILVDGVDLREYDLTAWRRQIAVIFQDFIRYHLPAQMNIGLGNRPLMDDLAVVQAAAARGGAVPVVEGLPYGYDTILGRWAGWGMDEGSELSGGEWQKIALSRAFMRHGDEVGSVDRVDEVAGADGMESAQVLVLDEPTAALDPQAEYDVYLRFRDLTRGKATILISHRFSTVKMADVIVVVEDGCVVERGDHASLVRRGGRYAELYEKQASRYR